MGKLITAKIDVSKIDSSKLFKGKKGTYCDLTIWVNDAPDQFGNDISIEQRTGKGDKKIFLGEGKFYEKPTGAAAPADDLPADDDGLPDFLKRQ